MSTEIHPVDQMLPTPPPAGAWPAACAGDVCRRGGRSPDHRPSAEAAAGGRCFPDLAPTCSPADLPRWCNASAFPASAFGCPVMMGVTFASVGPMLSMAAAPDIGLLGIYGSVIAAGIFGILAAPFISRLLPLFPPVVTGTIILVIGISLMRVGINWAGGGLPTLTKVVDGVPGAFPNPGYGQLAGPRHRAVRAAGRSRPDQMGLRLRRQRLGAARHRRRRNSRQRARRHAFRQGRGGVMGR